MRADMCVTHCSSHLPGLIMSHVVYGIKWQKAASQFLPKEAYSFYKRDLFRRFSAHPARGFLKYTGRNWPNPGCSFYMPVSMSRNHPVDATNRHTRVCPLGFLLDERLKRHERALLLLLLHTHSLSCVRTYGCARSRALSLSLTLSYHLPLVKKFLCMDGNCVC